MTDVTAQIREAKAAAIKLAAMGTVPKDAALEAMADALDRRRGEVLEANGRDMVKAEAMKAAGKLSDSMVKRLKVDDSKIDGMVAGIRDVTKLGDPVGETMSAIELDRGLMLYQVRCPIGMLGVIFESRPDVVPQIMSLCLKSGNAVAFKGGSEAAESNRALFRILTDAIRGTDVPAEAFGLMETREDISQILSLDRYIDLLIPRGSNEFVRYIQENTKIPVLGHAAGVCHVYVDEYADTDTAAAVVLDSKIQYPAVCNAMENLLVHSAVAEEFLPRIGRLFAENGVEMRVDARAGEIMKHIKTVKATEEDWDTEYGDLIVAVRVVDTIDEAIGFINTHGSHHTDAIVSEDKECQMRFVRYVDSADVFVNASTRFADGYRYGKGAEVGISTNKIHARGPVGMEGLMIYKYILVGNGQVVKDYAGAGAKKYTHVPKDEDFRL